MPRPLVKVLKWLGIAIGGLVALLVLALVVVWFVAGFRMSKTYDIQVQAVTVPTDEAGVARGRHLVHSIGYCTD